MPETFQAELDRLREEILSQGDRVLRLVTLAFDVAFADDQRSAEEILSLEEEIDRLDVKIEQHAVRALIEATRVGTTLDERQVRTLFVIIKINNELERIADLGVDVVDRGSTVSDRLGMPLTLRVMTNSTIGIVRDTNLAAAKGDPQLANIVLKCEDAMEGFRLEVMKAAERDVIAGTLSVELAQFMQSLAARCVSIADHCSNVAEQIIYAQTGKIVRHTDEGWVDVTQSN